MYSARGGELTFRPSKAGEVSQNSALFLDSWSVVIDLSAHQIGSSDFTGWFLAVIMMRKTRGFE